jgi:zinc transport system substrate-binding protein
MKSKNVFLVLFMLVTGHFAGAAVADERLRVYTVNYPLQYFAQRIAGEHAEVVFPAPAEVDPAFWMPDTKTVGNYQRADLILLNGANYAKWVGKVSLPRRRLVDTSAAFRGELIHGESGATHSHGSGAQHAHDGTAFTTWLDLRQAVQQAESIRQALTGRRPQLEKEFKNGFNSLKKDLLSLDAKLRQIISADPEQSIIASHPVYQYLARGYGLNLYSVMWEPDEYPEPSQWKALEVLAKTREVKRMIWEAEPAARTIARLKSAGIEPLVFNPCANVPAGGDFISVMNDNLAQLERVFHAQ